MNTSQKEKDFFTLYEGEADALFRFVSFRMADREKAKDIVQESFLRLWKVLISDKTPENARAYLYRIARNLLIDEYRRVQSSSLDEMMEGGFDKEGETSISPEEEIDTKEVLRVLRQLPENYSEILWLRFVEDWRVKDIAESLGVSENAASVRLHRGLQILREQLPSSKSNNRRV
jgi:RNA polymerase sigma-70 factor (ECF subfamily)